MPDSIIIVPQAAQTDPVAKYRVSTPQSLIDTDFEYGQQSVKWEQLALENNRQSTYYFTNNPLSISNIAGNGTTTIVISSTSNIGANQPIFLEETLDPNANGWWYTTSSNATAIVATTTNATISGTLYNPTATYGYQGYFFTNAGIAVTGSSTTAIIINSGTAYVNTLYAHGLSSGSLVYIVNTTGVTGLNGPWIVSNVPSANQFTFTTALTGTVTTGASQGTVYARPSGYVITRAYNGSVNFTAGASVPNQQMIRQTRRYFRYQSGKAIQFSTGTTMKPKLLVNSVTGAGNQITVNTFSPHNLTVNTYVQISGATVNAYNGIYKIATVVNGNQFTLLGATSITTSPAIQSNGTPPTVSPYFWYGSSNKVGFFDSQNGMFFEYNGQILYAVYRNSINQISGTVAVTQGNATVTGTSTAFTTQLAPNDFVVIRGQSYRVINITNDTQMFLAPEYRGASITNALVSKTIDTKIPQSQWNLDKCDGTGPSGYNVDLTKMQMLYIDYSWYGAGVIRWGMRTTNGAVTYCHSLQSNNIQTNAYLRSGNLPSHYESNGQGSSTVLYSSITSGANVIPIVSSFGFNPSGGTVKITAAATNGAIEYATYTSLSNSAVTGLAYDQLIGVTRGTTGGAVATAFTAAYPSSNSTPPVLVEYSPPDSVAVLSHWGSAVVMDGGFNNDFSLIFNYGTTANVTVANAATVPLLAIRLAPSVDNGTVGTLGNKEVVNRMTVQLKELGVLSSGFFLIQLILNGVATSFSGTFASPTQNNTFTSSICQVATNSNASATITGGESIGAAYTNSGTVSGNQSTLDLSQIAGIGNSILGGGLNNTVPSSTAGQFPDGPDILYVVATNTSGAAANIVCRLSWLETQA
jgi:hypothetical protein